MNRFIFSLLAVFLVPISIFSQECLQSRSDSIPFEDNTSVRLRYRDLLYAPLNELESFVPKYDTIDFSDIDVKVFTSNHNELFYTIGFTNKSNHQYLPGNRGSYYILRSKENGSIDHINIALRNEGNSYASIRPWKDRCLMDIYLFTLKNTTSGESAEGEEWVDEPVFRNIVIPMRINQVVEVPFSRIISRTWNKLDWDLILPEYSVLHTIVENMADLASASLSLLQDADDGAMDENGNYVFIETGECQEGMGGLNCAGFAKWIVDGLYYPRTGHYIDIDELKQKYPGERGNRWIDRYEDDRDPWFGLDWTRGLASMMSDLDNLSLGISGNDVTDIPFFQYQDDIGYSLDDLELILYYSAVKHPGNIYLGSVNGDFGSEPVLRQHSHVVVLFPYLTETGEFVTRVMERNMETGLQSLNERYQGHDIHLVRIEGSINFQLPE